MAIANDSAIYAFGGYGFYRYNNRLFKINPLKGTIEELNYQPKLSPRTWAASAVVGDKLYIFGGYGNESGEQELPGKYYYEMSCIDLKTMKMETLWTAESDKYESFQLSSEMIYNASDDTFYLTATSASGRLMKVWMNEPKWKFVTNSMGGDFGYKELTFNVYTSTHDNKLYAVMDRLMNDLTHEVSIYAINLPVMDDFVMPEEKAKDNSKLNWLFLLLIIPVAAGAYFIIKKRRNKKAGAGKGNSKDSAAGKNSGGAMQPAQLSTADIDDELRNKTSIDAIQEENVRYYNPVSSSIQVLGKFMVKDKEGNDITAQFTKRTRNLLLILLLHSETGKKGIEIHRLDETLWQEMDEESARNNRNVYMRKLRVLLEKVGNIEIVNDKIHYRAQLGSDVYFDYHEIKKLMERIEHGTENQEEDEARSLELLFEGPLLPNYSFEWLDKFKSDYSSTVISLLMRQLNREMEKGNDNIAIKIARTILLHDPFSDKALATQCSIFCRYHKKGIAKNIYDNFCKNYETCMGEKYYISFADVCK